MEKDPVGFRLKEGVFYGSINVFKGECEHEGEGICTFGSLAKILFNLSKYCDWTFFLVLKIILLIDSGHNYNYVP